MSSARAVLMHHRFTEPTPTSQAGHVHIAVVVDSWEIECCAPPPVVGESTTWTVSFIPAGTSSSSATLEHTRTWLVEQRGTGTTLTAGPVVAGWNNYYGSPPVPGRRELLGHLYGGVHGNAPQDVPETTGTVQRVRVTSHLYRRSGERSFEPVAGSIELVDVPRSPKWFDRADLSNVPDTVRMQTGVLIDITVPERRRAT